MIPTARLPEFSIKAKVQQISETKNYNHQLLNIPALWRQSKGRHVRVGILDTGMPVHRDLEVSKSWSAIHGYEEDFNGHGTHVAGLLGAKENGRGVVGIAPECELYNYTTMNMDGTGNINGIIEAVYRAVEDKCDIINMSLGISAWTIEGLRDACQEAADKGVIVVAATGNEAGNIDQPASYDCVIAVGAVNENRGKADFSNYGKEMDFAVGGVDLFSTYLDNGYAKMSGTSMACPVFAGLCAVILGAHKEKAANGETSKTPINGVKDMIDHIKRFAYDVGGDGWDESYGYGIPFFHAPDEAPTKSSKSVILGAIDKMTDELAAIRQAVSEMI